MRNLPAQLLDLFRAGRGKSHRLGRLSARTDHVAIPSFAWVGMPDGMFLPEKQVGGTNEHWISLADWRLSLPGRGLPGHRVIISHL